MRALTTTLSAEQQKGAVRKLVKIALTGGTTYAYEKDRIIKITETEDGSLQSADVVLRNADATLTDLDFKGYEATLYFGLVTSQGDEYEALPPMWVVSHQFDSDPNNLDCVLSLSGIFNLMMEDHASESYIPASDDKEIVKNLIDAIAGATLACFSHCTAYDTIWESGYDTLADTYTPADSFRIYVNGDRKSAIDRLLQYTKNVAVVKSDGKIHIFKPTTSGSTYDYEYALDSGHPFFAKALRNSLVIPNYIVVKSRTDDDDQYTGYATDATSYALLPKREYFETYLESNDQAGDIAEAKLAIAQMWSQAGSASVPMNLGAEVFDYVKVTDSREGDYRVGNIGQIRRYYSIAPKGQQSSRWEMTFVFGNWQTVRKALANLNLTSDELQNYFSRLVVKDLYAEHIQADSLDMVWIDPEGNIDLSQIGDTLDNLPDGEIYARVKSLHLDAGGIKVDENIIYSAGYDPTGKFDLGTNTLDDIPEGAVYQRVRSAALTAGGLILLDQVQVGDTYGLINKTDISAGHILLSSVVQSSTYQTVSSTQKTTWNDKMDGDTTLDGIPNGSTYVRVRSTCIDSGYIELNSVTRVNGEWYDESGVEIDAANGINIYGTTNALTTRASKTGTVQCSVNSSGQITAGAGNVLLGATGITIVGQVLTFKEGSTTRGYVYGSSFLHTLVVEGSTGLGLISDAGDVLISASGYGINLVGNYLGVASKASAPTASQGRMYYNTTDKKLYLYTTLSGTTKWWTFQMA